MDGIFWLASYPKSGNTWFRAFLHALQQVGAAGIDINRDLRSAAIASDRAWLDRVLGFSTAELGHEEVERLRPAIYRWASRANGIQFRKIHDACWTMADGDLLISRSATLGALCIVRNPLDIVASLASHSGCSIDEAIRFMGHPEAAVCGSRASPGHQVRQRLGSWSMHVRSWLDTPGLQRQVIRYEDMLDAPETSFAEAARFLTLAHDRPGIVAAIRATAFAGLADQEARSGFRERAAGTTRFFRRGRRDGWRTELSDRQIQRVLADHGETMQRLGYLDAGGSPR